MKILSGIAITVVIGIVGICFFVYSGLIDVSATTQESAPVKWILENTRVNAIQRRADDIVVPDLADQVSIARGAKAFDEMCAGCHGGPGVKPFLGASDMNPPPPDLATTAEQRTPGEIFWVVKNGIRMTGMPAWGVTHSDNELWDLVAFMGQLPSLSDNDYQKLASAVQEDGHAHDHGSTREAEKTVELNHHNEITTENSEQVKNTHGHDDGHDHAH